MLCLIKLIEIREDIAFDNQILVLVGMWQDKGIEGFEAIIQSNISSLTLKLIQIDFYINLRRFRQR